MSRVDSSIKSCLDLVIMSLNLLPFLTKMVVDDKQKYCSMRVGVRNNKSKVVKSDHHPIILSLENMPKAKHKSGKKPTRWNMFKPGGWEEYEKFSNEKAEEVDKVVENKTLSNEDVIRKFDGLQNTIKYKAFGKTRPVTKAASNRKLEIRLKTAAGLDDDEKVKEVMRKQMNEMEKQINDIKHCKYGRATNVFKMREQVCGSRKAPQKLMQLEIVKLMCMQSPMMRLKKLL